MLDNLTRQVRWASGRSDMLHSKRGKTYLHSLDRPIHTAGRLLLRALTTIRRLAHALICDVTGTVCKSLLSEGGMSSIICWAFVNQSSCQDTCFGAPLPPSGFGMNLFVLARVGPVSFNACAWPSVYSRSAYRRSTDFATRGDGSRRVLITR